MNLKAVYSRWRRHTHSHARAHTDPFVLCVELLLFSAIRLLFNLDFFFSNLQTHFNRNISISDIFAFQIFGEHQ